MLKQLWRYAYTLLGLIFRRPLPGVSVIGVTSEGKIILIRRRDDGKWALPGGLVDWGETIAQSVHRELREETGFGVVELIRLGGVYSGARRDPRLHSVCVTVVATVEPVGAVEDSLEVAAVKAFAVDQLPWGQLSHDHEQQLADYLANRIAIA